METKFKLVETEEYTLAISDKEITGFEDNIWVFKSNRFWLWDSTMALRSDHKPKKVIAYKPKGNAPELDLPLLPEEECCEGDGSNCNGSCCIVEDDVEKLAKDLANKKGDDDLELEGHIYASFIEGHKSATKKYSEEDLRKAFLEGNKYPQESENLPDFYLGNYFEKFLQFIKQPKSKWFVAEMETARIPYGDDGWKTIETGLKTTTLNNKIYLVGKYLN